MAKGSRLSVAELAGKFACQAPLPKEDEANKPVRRRPPRTLPLPASNDMSQARDEKAEVGSQPARKNRNSALIEKLQASLSPTALLPSPLSPGAGKVSPFFPVQSPCSPVSPTSASKLIQPETPASFETPAEGTVLQSINKGRIRHSIKRRPPSRQIRKSSGDEVGTEEEKATSPVSGQTNPDITENDVFEKQKEPKEETEGVDPLSATFKQQQDQQLREASTDSEQQFLSSTGDEEESRECVVSAEQEEKVEEKKMSEQPELDSSKEESLKQEVQSEPVTATEDKIEEEVKKEEKDGGM